MTFLSISLIEYGVNLNLKDNNGNTGLIIACENGYDDIVEYLIEHGAAIDLKNKKGETALEIAVSNSYKNIMNLLNKDKMQEKVLDINMKKLNKTTKLKKRKEKEITLVE